MRIIATGQPGDLINKHLCMKGALWRHLSVLGFSAFVGEPDFVSQAGIPS